MSQAPDDREPAATAEPTPHWTHALTSWRTASVTLLSFSSGLPLGLVWIAIPDWMRASGVDIRLVGLLTVTHAPWSFKLLWSPLMDRFAPPILDRRRGWMAIAQVALALLTLSLAGVASTPEAPWIVFAVALAIAVASASQDIVIDAYAVEVLRREEQGIAVGARTAFYRGAMYVAGALAITLAARLSWPAVCALLALAYAPMLVVTRLAPRPEERIVRPGSLRDAVWLPFLGFLGRHRSLEILAFVLFYKLADNLAQSLQRPFLVDMGYDALDRGVALGTIGLVGTIVGTFLGGAVTSALGLGHSLWVFGLLQIFSNVGFIAVSMNAPHRPLMYGAMGFEAFTTGLGMGAFGVLLLRLTQKRFSATQYALFSSVFGLPRIVAGPITGVLVHAVGWTWFFWLTMLAGIPGLVLLARFVPPGTREPTFAVEPPRDRRPLSVQELAVRGLVGAAASFLLAVAAIAVLSSLEGVKQGTGFHPLAAAAATLPPTVATDWIALVGSLLFAAVGGLLTAAVFAARHAAPSDDVGP